MTRKKLDPVGVIEACYLPASSDVGWLSGIAESLLPIDGGYGLVALTYDIQDRARFRLGELAEAGCEYAWRETTRLLLADLPPDLAGVLRNPKPPVGFLSRKLRPLGPNAAAFVGQLFHANEAEVEDLFTIFAAEPSSGALIGVPVDKRGFALAPRTIQQLARVSAHVISSQRLRRVAGLSGSATDGIDAVLDPGGRVHDARGAARDKDVRETLTAAVRRIECARGALRRTDPEEALTLWKGLVDGTWSLVDQEERDGRRWVLARRNPPDVRDPKALARREREVVAYAAMGHSNKYIAYLLGLAPSTVAVHLDVARRKLGLASRRELIAMFGSSAPRRSEPSMTN